MGCAILPLDGDTMSIILYSMLLQRFPLRLHHVYEMIELRRCWGQESRMSLTYEIIKLVYICNESQWRYLECWGQVSEAGNNGSKAYHIHGQCQRLENHQPLTMLRARECRNLTMDEQGLPI